MNDSELINLVLKGKLSSFNQLVEPYLKSAQQTAFLLLNDYNLSEDAIQEGMIQAFQSLKRYDSSKASFKTWFNRIVLNCALKIYRKRRWKHILSKSENDNHNSPEQLFLLEEETRYIYQEVKKLNVKHQTVIILHYFQELSLEEISETLDIKIGTVKSRLFTARKQLKEVLQLNSPHHIKEVWQWKEN